MGIDLEGKYLFDLNYLDCSKSQYVSYLKQMGYRVEALYYNCLDSTNEIMIQIIKQKNPDTTLMSWVFNILIGN